MSIFVDIFTFRRYKLLAGLHLALANSVRMLKNIAPKTTLKKQRSFIMQKKHLILVLLMCLLLAMPMNALAAESTIKVSVNGQMLQLDAPPFIENGRTLVPLRGIFEAIDAKVSWDSGTKTVTALRDDVTIKIQLGNANASKNGQQIKLDTPAKAIDGRTFVPLRFIGESFGAQVLWDSATRSITITDQKKKLSLQEVAEQKKAVVKLNVYDKRNELISTGSGFIVESNGKIMTNYHVIDTAHSVEVITNNNRKYKASGVLSYDVGRDIAVLQLEKASSLPVLKLGDSDKVKVGEDAVAIGSPLGIQNTVSNGIISNHMKYEDGYTYLQTSAAVSPGSSGGSLLNMQGEVIGVIVAQFLGQNLNLAIPINEVKSHLASTTITSFADVIKAEYPALELSKYAKYLGEYFHGFPVPFDGPRPSIHTFSSIYVKESTDQKDLAIVLAMNLTEYQNFVRDVKKGFEDDFGFWLYLILNDAELRYPNKNITVSLAVEGEFTQEMISFFGSNNIYTSENNKQIVHLIELKLEQNKDLEGFWYYEF